MDGSVEVHNANGHILKPKTDNTERLCPEHMVTRNNCFKLKNSTTLTSGSAPLPKVPGHDTLTVPRRLVLCLVWIFKDDKNIKFIPVNSTAKKKHLKSSTQICFNRGNQGLVVARVSNRAASFLQ